MEKETNRGKSLSVYFPSLDKDFLTKPESVIDPQDKLELCSNINKSKNDRQFLATVFEGRKLALSGYSIRSGCCEYLSSRSCYLIYSWSILGSNDNRTWTKIHSVEKDKEHEDCKEKSFKVGEKGSYSMFKIVQDEPEPRCWYCMNINKLKFYGSMSESDGDVVLNDDEISIIGRVKRE